MRFPPAKRGRPAIPERVELAIEPLIFAHRGASAAAPENTLPAFEKALEMGADGIELDVQATADGVLVVFHDYRLERVTNGAGLLRRRTLADLAGIDAGARFGPSFAGVPIPTLEQVLDLVEDRCIVNVEIKNLAWNGGREAVPLARLIRRADLYDRTIVSSFNPFALAKMRRLDPAVTLGLLYLPKLPRRRPARAARARGNPLSIPFRQLLFHFASSWVARWLAPEALHPHHQSVDAALVSDARRRARQVNAWTVNDVAEARRLARLGVNGIITDRPDLMRQGLASAAPSWAPVGGAEGSPASTRG